MGDSGINNRIYHALGEQWYTAEDHPIALLRAEGRLKADWVAEQFIERHEQLRASASLLDVGCGAGLLTNALAVRAFKVGELPFARIEGVDLSEDALQVARQFDPSGRVRYLVADAFRLPYADGEFDVVCAMDFLEHVEDPRAAIHEIARVLAPGGFFFFHTFNRTWQSRWLVIHAMQLFVPNTPDRLHVHELFITPKEMQRYCSSAGLHVSEWQGIRPVFASRAMVRLFLTGRVGADFRFRLIRSRKVGYLGVAVQREFRPRQNASPFATLPSVL